MQKRTDTTAPGDKVAIAADARTNERAHQCRLLLSVPSNLTPRLGATLRPRKDKEMHRDQMPRKRPTKPVLQLASPFVLVFPFPSSSFSGGTSVDELVVEALQVSVVTLRLVRDESDANIRVALSCSWHFNRDTPDQVGCFFSFLLGELLGGLLGLLGMSLCNGRSIHCPNSVAWNKSQIDVPTSEGFQITNDLESIGGPNGSDNPAADFPVMWYREITIREVDYLHIVQLNHHSFAPKDLQAPIAPSQPPC